MDKNKHIQIDIFNHRNIYADVFIPIMRRPGFNNGIKTIYNVIFSKQIGVSLSEKDELDKLILMIKKFKSHNINYQVTSGKLNFKPENSAIQIIKNSFVNYEPNKNLIKNTIDKIFFNKEILTFTPEGTKLSAIKDALFYTLNSFETSEDSVNASKMVNITVKLLYWLDTYLKDILIKKTETLDKSIVNSKIIHLGDMSHQDSYYLLLSYYLGFDTIFISFENTSTRDFAKKTIELAKLTKFDNFTKNNSLLALTSYKENNDTQSPRTKADIKSKPSNLISNQSNQNRNTKRPNISSSSINFERKKPNTGTNTKTKLQNPLANNHVQAKAKLEKKELNANIIISHKKFDGDLKDFLAPLKDRAGFAGEPSPIHPVYFTRYIGVDSDKNLYRNRLFQFDNTLSKEFKNYIKFESPLEIGNYNDINKKTNLIWQEYKEIKLGDLDDLVKYLNASDVFSFILDEELKNRCALAIKEVLKIAFHGSTSIATSKVKNLVIKLIGWSNDYNKIFSGYSYSKKHNPKAMFYGDIKSHEALFLIFLYYCGVDVIYINSFQDDVFEVLDPDLSISNLHTLDKVYPMEDFPTSEVMIIQQTTAYEASEEIAKIVYNDQDGVYKPWQFESYKTMPLTLKTTYDELFILWDEHARIRTGFKVEKNTVYIPNMFVKISATHEDIKDYWNIVNKATTSKLTQLYSKLPFTNIDFSAQELYALDTAFENHRTLSFDKLKNHSLYKYSHLSNELQNLIYDKLSMLLNTDILIKSDSDDNLRLKILLTILKLNPELLKLIQNFDFPAHIPKLVIYDADETTFSEADSIAMAFLYIMGFDICVFTPTGYNNFEMFIDQKYYSVFKLPSKQFNLELPDLKRHSGAKAKGFWASIFG